MIRVIGGSGNAVHRVRRGGDFRTAGADRAGLPALQVPACGKQFNERNGGILNRAQYPSDVIALVVFWRLRYKLSLRDLPEMFLIRGIEFSYEAVRDWEAKLTPSLIDSLRRRRKGRIGKSWYVDESVPRQAA
jgi:putative transposase